MLHKVVINANNLREALANVRGAVMICYPMGLPDCDPVQQLLNGTFKGQLIVLEKEKKLELIFLPSVF